jgi:3-dehydroquinate dehydratase-2
MSAIGLELGGTWVRAVLLEESGAVAKYLRETTPDNPQETGPLLHALWKELGASRIVGVAAAPVMDPGGRIRNWPSRPEYTDTEILGPLLAEGLSLLILDDVSAATVAEHFTATEDMCNPSSSVLLSFGTGVGGGLVIADRLWSGATGQAMNIGHVPVPAAEGRPCSCGRQGCLQAAASGRFLDQQAEQLGLTRGHITESAEGGDLRAIKLIESVAEPIAQSVLLVQNLLEPDRILLGGGLLEQGPLFEMIVRASQDLGVVRPLLRGRWQTWAGALGAAAEALRQSGLRLSRLFDGSSQPKYRIALLQGPNLNLLGEREPAHYGTSTLDEICSRLTGLAGELSCHLYCFQSNHEGALADWIQERRGRLDGAIVNPAALTARGYSLLESLTGSSVPFVEVHLSNVDARESWHQESCFAAAALGRVSGMREIGYEMALRGLVRHLDKTRALRPS